MILNIAFQYSGNVKTDNNHKLKNDYNFYSAFVYNLSNR